MKTLIIAAMTVIGLGTAAAYAGTGDSQTPDAYAQQQFGAVTPPPASGYVEPQTTSQGTVSAYVAQGSHGTWLFPPHEDEGNNN